MNSRLLSHRLFRKYSALVHEDLAATYSRDIQKWLLVAPVIGVVTGLMITAIAVMVLDVIWAAVLPYYLAHHWAIAVGLVAGFVLTGLIMQFCTADPNEHSTEEIVRAYHNHQGYIDVHSFWWKSLALVSGVAPEKWDQATVAELADRNPTCVTADSGLGEALRLLVREHGTQMILVTEDHGRLEGIVTKTDILRAVNIADARAQPPPKSDAK
ncbi:CBS domain-containing protein [Candidatus Binatus sp.]|uniref:CBS domain-containing protein n=1 Tax=Candidatus Binatus sp. TaxID=2811406 RepID=UPI00272D3A04|nr:CBS domain-containing protein [Candidatus Binatus sp.]